MNICIIIILSFRAVASHPSTISHYDDQWVSLKYMVIKKTHLVTQSVSTRGVLNRDIFHTEVFTSLGRTVFQSLLDHVDSICLDGGTYLDRYVNVTSDRQVPFDNGGQFASRTQKIAFVGQASLEKAAITGDGCGVLLRLEGHIREVLRVREDISEPSTISHYDDQWVGLKYMVINKTNLITQSLSTRGVLNRDIFHTEVFTSLGRTVLQSLLDHVDSICLDGGTYLDRDVNITSKRQVTFDNGGQFATRTELVVFVGHVFLEKAAISVDGCGVLIKLEGHIREVLREREDLTGALHSLPTNSGLVAASVLSIYLISFVLNWQTGSMTGLARRNLRIGLTLVTFCSLIISMIAITFGTFLLTVFLWIPFFVLVLASSYSFLIRDKKVQVDVSGPEKEYDLEERKKVLQGSEEKDDCVMGNESNRAVEEILNELSAKMSMRIFSIDEDILREGGYKPSTDKKDTMLQCYSLIFIFGIGLSNIREEGIRLTCFSLDYHWDYDYHHCKQRHNLVSVFKNGLIDTVINIHRGTDAYEKIVFACLSDPVIKDGLLILESLIPEIQDKVVGGPLDVAMENLCSAFLRSRLVKYHVSILKDVPKSALQKILGRCCIDCGHCRDCIVRRRLDEDKMGWKDCKECRYCVSCMRCWYSGHCWHISHSMKRISRMLDHDIEEVCKSFEGPHLTLIGILYRMRAHISMYNLMCDVVDRLKEALTCKVGPSKVAVDPGKRDQVSHLRRKEIEDDICAQFMKIVRSHHKVGMSLWRPMIKEGLHKSISREDLFIQLSEGNIEKHGKVCETESKKYTPSSKSAVLKPFLLESSATLGTSGIAKGPPE